MSGNVKTHKFNVTLKIPVEIEILRETNPEELPKDAQIDREYNGWWWRNVDDCNQYSDEFFETREDALDEAKKHFLEYFGKLINER
jgi:hypothetical protein